MHTILELIHQALKTTYNVSTLNGLFIAQDAKKIILQPDDQKPHLLQLTTMHTIYDHYHGRDNEFAINSQTHHNPQDPTFTPNTIIQEINQWLQENSKPHGPKTPTTPHSNSHPTQTS